MQGLLERINYDTKRMKPTDLRLGNIVRIKSTGEIIHICMIDFMSVHFIRDGQMCARFINEIEPVLIRDVHNLLPPIPQLMWVDKVMCEDLYYYNDIVITDLHELQNIHHAITGNEIEIKL